MHPELRWTLAWAGIAAVLTSVAGFGWFEHRSQQLEFGRVRARLEVQARELTATRGELERLSRLISLDLSSTRGTEARTISSGTTVEPPARAAQLPTQEADLNIAPSPSPAELESLKAATTLLQGALATGRWTGTDSARFRQHLAGVAEEDKAALMTELTTAINTDKLRLDGAPAPF